ncbi:hypothetical protein KC367_g169 [Hortaea werneckii]|nr:hypothetical protein KC367_g169 [Hortaea werneckii]
MSDVASAQDLRSRYTNTNGRLCNWPSINGGFSSLRTSISGRHRMDRRMVHCLRARLPAQNHFRHEAGDVYSFCVKMSILKTPVRQFSGHPSDTDLCNTSASVEFQPSAAYPGSTFRIYSSVISILPC